MEADSMSMIELMPVGPDGVIQAVREGMYGKGSWDATAIRIARAYTEWYRELLLDLPAYKQPKDTKQLTIALFLRNKQDGGPWHYKKVRVTKPVPEDTYEIAQ